MSFHLVFLRLKITMSNVLDFTGTCFVSARLIEHGICRLRRLILLLCCIAGCWFREIACCIMFEDVPTC